MGIPHAIHFGAFYAFIATDPTITRADLTPEARARVKRIVHFTEGSLARDYVARSGARVTPLYGSAEEREADYTLGSIPVITSVVEKVAVVSEQKLTWEQVIEFRRDSEARLAYRRFIHWLDSEMVGKPASYICDAVNSRLEQYEWAIRKHGLQTVVGALERTVSASSILGSAIAGTTIQYVTSQPLLAVLTGAGLLIANTAIYAASALISREEILLQNRDLAFVHITKSGLNTANPRGLTSR